jgi:hypothetical protein
LIGERSGDCLAQDGLVRATFGAASRELPVNYSTRQASNAVVLCPRRDVWLVHVKDFDIVGRARNALHQLDRLVARRATGGENLDLFPVAASFHPPPLKDQGDPWWPTRA